MDDEGDEEDKNSLNGIPLPDCCKVACLPQLIMLLHLVIRKYSFFMVATYISLPKHSYMDTFVGSKHEPSRYMDPWG